MTLTPLRLATGASALILTAPLLSSPLLVWNASPSSSPGLYRASAEEPGTGDMVLIRPNPAILRFALTRGYVKQPVPFVKQIAAAGGDVICRIGSEVAINGGTVADAKARDESGRTLPEWSGCKLLRANEVFVLGAHPDSFDSRYFGPVLRQELQRVSFLCGNVDS